MGGQYEYENNITDIPEELSYRKGKHNCVMLNIMYVQCLLHNSVFR